MKGLTLIELLITIALVSILMSVGVPSFQSVVSRYQARTAVSSLKRILMQARTKAIEEHQAITICPISHNQCSNNWSLPITLFADINTNQKIDQNETLIYKIQTDISAGYWQKKSITKPFVRFNQLGHAFSSATTFLYCPRSGSLNNAKQIIISFQGRIRSKNYLSSKGMAYSNVSPLSCI
jgi:type IV fimbrial biogenesis protein FimT